MAVLFRADTIALAKSWIVPQDPRQIGTPPPFRIKNVACNEPTYERNTMFKNREIRVRLAKADETPDLTDAVQTIAISRDDIIAVRDWMTKAGLAIGGLWLIGKAVDATCEIAVHHGTKD